MWFSKPPLPSWRKWYRQNILHVLSFAAKLLFLRRETLFNKKIQKKYSSSLSRQSIKTKPSTNSVSVGPEPLLCLEFNKSYGQNVSEINLFKKFNFQVQSH